MKLILNTLMVASGLTTASAVAQIFASDAKAALSKIDPTTGRITEESPEMPEELQGQQLSSIDKKRGIYYVVGFNATSRKTNLIGWNVKEHKRTVDIELPLSESAFVGVGQAVDADPVTGDVFVLGRGANVEPNSYTHELLRLHYNTSFATSEHIVNLVGIDVLDGSSTYDSKNGVEYIASLATNSTPPEFNIIAVDVKTKAIKVIKQDPEHGKIVQNLDFDEKNERLYGFGEDLKKSPPERALMYFDVKTNKFVEVSDIPKEFYMQEGNLVTFDSDARVYYAMLTIGGAPNVTTWKHSDKCIGCKESSSAQCCYDPAQGPDSYTCFAVSNCTQITDGGGAPDLSNPVHLFGIHVDSGSVISKTPPVCQIVTNGSYPACPWSIESLM